MDEYIKREAAVREILGLTILDDAVAAYADAVLYRIQHIPAADVEPVVHGRWHLNENGKWACSECDGLAVEHPDEPDKWQAQTACCPSCGAKIVEANKMGAAALRAQQEQPNEPLTLEELREMELHQWVWIDALTPFECNEKVSAYYKKHYDYTHNEAFCCGYPGISFGFDYADYGKTWLAYRRKPGREDD